MRRYRLAFCLVTLLAACTPTPPANVPTAAPAQATTSAGTAPTAQPTAATQPAPTANVQPAPTAATQPAPTAATQPAPTANAQPASTVTATQQPAVPAPPFERTLALQTPALQGEDVRQAQARLNELGYSQVGTVDGVFGANTEVAVRAFQTLNQLEIDGVIGQNTWGLLFDSIAVRYELHPIVDTQRGYLLGTANGAGWLPAERITALIDARDYRLLDQSGAQPATAGSAARIGEVPCTFTSFVDFGSTIDPAQRIALDGDWNVLPRPISEVPTDTATLVGPLTSALRVLGLATPTIQITRALRGDLDGDGTQETIVVATYRASGEAFVLPSAEPGDYSLLAVIPDGGALATVIAADVITSTIEFGAPLEFNLLGVWDLSGDGRMEVVASSAYYEGDSTSVYAFNGTTATEVIGSGCGV
ncbi:MAG: peptidoglycan-binding protein [Roseiflexaceae bacterium]|nr:peptidoglycan-binding protein [Roseiflexaceae bacterium]